MACARGTLQSGRIGEENPRGWAHELSLYQRPDSAACEPDAPARFLAGASGSWQNRARSYRLTVNDLWGKPNNRSRSMRTSCVLVNAMVCVLWIWYSPGATAERQVKGGGKMEAGIQKLDFGKT